MKILKVIRSQTRKNPLMVVGLVVCILWFAVSLVPNLVAPYGPLEQNIRERLQSPSTNHIFGTDQLGRDVLSRVLYGGRISLPAGLLVVVSAAIVGTAMGSVAGYIGGAWDETLMRITEVFMSFPIIILAMAITAALGPSTINAVLAMVVVWWPNYARIVRSLVLSVKANEYVQASRAIGANEYVQASRAIGASRAYILFRTILPNCVAPAVVMATLDIGNAILIFASLSFLGLGPEPSAAEWGRMVADGIDYFDQWWLSAFPGIAIFTVILSFNLVGDGLRDLLDPRMRKALTR
jgi:peptide/nickel transport system permease protein